MKEISNITRRGGERRGRERAGRKLETAQWQLRNEDINRKQEAE
jgi:hypothetical protein